MKKTLLLGSLFVAGTIMAGAPGAAAPAADQGASAKDDNKRICRRDTSVGTRLGGRICRTKAEWKEVERENRHHARELIEDSQGRSDEKMGDKPL